MGAKKLLIMVKVLKNMGDINFINVNKKVQKNYL